MWRGWSFYVLLYLSSGFCHSGSVWSAPAPLCVVSWQVLGGCFRSLELKDEELCCSQQGSGVVAQTRGSCCSGITFPGASRISPLLPAESIAAVLLALLSLFCSVCCWFFFLLFFLIFSGFLSGKYSPEYSPKEQWDCPAHEICQLQLRCDEQEPHSGRPSLIPAVGIVSHSALRAVPSWEGGRGMGERGRMWGLLPGIPPLPPAEG